MTLLFVPAVRNRRSRRWHVHHTTIICKLHQVAICQRYVVQDVDEEERRQFEVAALDRFKLAGKAWEAGSCGPDRADTCYWTTYPSRSTLKSRWKRSEMVVWSAWPCRMWNLWQSLVRVVGESNILRFISFSRLKCLVFKFVCFLGRHVLLDLRFTQYIQYILSSCLAMMLCHIDMPRTITSHTVDICSWVGIIWIPIICNQTGTVVFPPGDAVNHFSLPVPRMMTMHRVRTDLEPNPISLTLLNLLNHRTLAHLPWWTMELVDIMAKTRGRVP